MAVTGAVFVVGVLVYTASNRFGRQSFLGELAPAAGTSCSTQTRPVWPDPVPYTYKYPTSTPPAPLYTCQTESDFLGALRRMMAADANCKTTADISCGPNTCAKDGGVVVTTTGPTIVGGRQSTTLCPGNKPKFNYTSYSYSCTRAQACKSTLATSVASVPSGWKCCANATVAECVPDTNTCPSGQPSTGYYFSNDCNYVCRTTGTASSM